jgi:ankyrin repeat protein
MRVEVCEFLVSIGSNPFALSHRRTRRYVRKIVQPHCATNQFRSAADFAWDFPQYASTPSKFKDAMRRLLPPPEDLDSRSFTRLHEAVRAVSRESVESLLLTASSNINVTDSQGRSPLWWVAQKGDVAVVDHLRRCGADPGIGDTGGRTPLHGAAGRGDGDIVESLLPAGADPKVKDEWGETPLQRAGMAVSTGTISRLLKHGVDIHSENIYGQTVLATIVTHSHVPRSLVMLLLDHYANVEQSVRLR